MKVDFFIVGAPKAGTTSLYHYLNEHPQVEMSLQKEPDYFSDKAIQRKTGARGLRSILESILLNSMFNLPGMTGVSEVVVNEEAVSGNSEPLMIYQDLKEKPA